MFCLLSKLYFERKDAGLAQRMRAFLSEESKLTFLFDTDIISHVVAAS
jgi:hypothetical protein